ncbi:acyl-CoA thioesterase [Bacillus andreraoultii]|uniref:acyl-CoA thioesterase n=1 Tax=Bacillus andreraoultii TaxID=1499685 RepID=UPI00053A583A|nr:thioesterase family protein [Bacillus andreraoultii]
MDQNHPFDKAIRLSGEAGNYRGRTTEQYANMVGPYGGIIAATLLKAAMDHPECLGEPLSLTVNYAAPIADGDFEIKAKPARTNRSTQHWIIEFFQNSKTVITGTAIFATRRKTWSKTEVPFPSVPPETEFESIRGKSPLAWMKNYDIRMTKGPSYLLQTEAEEANSENITLMRDEPRRPIDFLSLTALCDVFTPRIFLRRKYTVPIGTVSLTIYFHVDSEELRKHGDHEVVGYSRALKFYNGFYDQTAEVWTREGQLLATTTQIVYFKE